MRNAVLCALFLWGVSAALQFQNAAFSADIGADPDEPAHAVTSLMLRDYLARGLIKGEHPLHFARDYYDHFPKVALGHYPPGFYLLSGAWLLPCPTKHALMLFIGLLSGVLGAVTAVMACRCGLARVSASIVGLWVVLLPITQKLSMLVMSDLLLASLCLLAVAAFASFLDKPAAPSALLFGVLAAAAILTKASAVALALVPPLSILALGRWRLCLNWRLWLAPVPVALTALPWTLFTMKITQEGMSGQSTAEYFPEALKFYASAAVQTFGPIILVAATIPVIVSVPKLWKRSGHANTNAVALGCFGISLASLYLVSPTGFSSRYLLPLAPLLLIAAAFAFGSLCAMWHHRMAAGACVGLGAMASLILLGGVEPKVASGIAAMAEEITTRAPGGKVLISSDARGEGALVAEMAFRIPDRCASPWSIVRASKFMASSDWSGRDYQAAFANREEFTAALQRDRIGWIVEDVSVPDSYLQKHHLQIKEWCGALSVEKTITASRQGATTAGSVILFQTPAIGEGKP